MKVERSKKILSKEDFDAICKLKLEERPAILMAKGGYSFAETKGKNEQELRTMLFDRVTLEDKSMIDFLCGGDYQLKKVLVGYGTVPKELAGKSREELERMYIEKVGLDEIITAREEVIKQDEISGEKRTHRYENTLEGMRGERGKSIAKNVAEATSNIERTEIIESLSKYEIEDAQRYSTASKNLKDFASDFLAPIL